MLKIAGDAEMFWRSLNLVCQFFALLRNFALKHFRQTTNANCDSNHFGSKRKASKRLHQSWTATFFNFIWSHAGWRLMIMQCWMMVGRASFVASFYVFLLLLRCLFSLLKKTLAATARSDLPPLFPPFSCSSLLLLTSCLGCPWPRVTLIVVVADVAESGIGRRRQRPWLLRLIESLLAQQSCCCCFYVLLSFIVRRWTRCRHD